MLTRKEQNAKRKEYLNSMLVPGAFVKNVWGATMQRVNYYEIVGFEGKDVLLAPARISGDPSPNCSSSVVTLLGSALPNSIQGYVRANVRNGYLIKKGESVRNYWSKYEFVQIGDTTHTWSD